MNNLLNAAILADDREFSHLLHYIALWAGATKQEQREFVEHVEFYPIKLTQGHLKKAMQTISKSIKL